MTAGAARKHLSKALLQEDLVLFGLAHLQVSCVFVFSVCVSKEGLGCVCVCMCVCACV